MNAGRRIVVITSRRAMTRDAAVIADGTADDDECVFARVLARALAQCDPRSAIEEAMTTSAHKNGGVSTLDARAQATLARALRTCAKFSPSYARRAAREACKTIEREAREGRGDGETRDDLAETMFVDDLDDLDDDEANAESEGWRRKVFLCDATPAREDAIEAREMRPATALGTRVVDAVRARTQTDALAGSTGAFAWSAGFTASEFIMSDVGGTLVRDRRVVELGSGTGVTATTLCRAAPRAMTATDRDARALENLRMNLEVNREMDAQCGTYRVRVDDLEAPVVTRGASSDAALEASIRALDWERADVDIMRRMRADFVLAADCSYDPTLIPGLVRAIGALLGATPSDDDAERTPLETLDAASARSRLVDAYATTPCALVLSAVRQEETMRVLIRALERARLYPVDVTSVVEEVRADASSPKFLFADARRAHAGDPVRAFACTAARA